jgi:diguanylate cyclase (GGDEF)-like protein
MMPVNAEPPTVVAAPDVALHAVLAQAFEAVLARRGDLLMVKDANSGRVAHVNPAMASFLRRDPDAVMGMTDIDLFDTAVATALRAADQTALAQTQPLLSEHAFEWGGARHEFSVLRVAGEPVAGRPRWLCSVWTDLAAAHQREAQLRSALQQLEREQRANEALRREVSDPSLRDAESGLYTRAHFEDHLRREVDLSNREHREFAVVLVELDPPSERVGQFGEQGQVHIREAMGRLLRGGTRAMDSSCRLDDRRFAVLLSGVGLATAHSRVEGLRRQCATQIVVVDGQELGFTVSMGVASFPHTAQTQEDLLAACASALAEAQRRGGNHVTLAAIRFEP